MFSASWHMGAEAGHWTPVENLLRRRYVKGEEKANTIFRLIFAWRPCAQETFGLPSTFMRKTHAPEFDKPEDARTLAAIDRGLRAAKEGRLVSAKQARKLVTKTTNRNKR
jgi:hypothetical protein